MGKENTPYKVSDTTSSLIECKRLRNELIDSLYSAFRGVYGEERGTEIVDSLETELDTVEKIIDEALIAGINNNLNTASDII